MMINDTNLIIKLSTDCEINGIEAAQNPTPLSSSVETEHRLVWLSISNIYKPRAVPLPKYQKTVGDVMHA